MITRLFIHVLRTTSRTHIMLLLNRLFFGFFLAIIAWHSSKVDALDDQTGRNQNNLAETQTLKLMSYNVWYGFTKKPEPRHTGWLQWMSRQAPDVVSLQELNGYTSQELAKEAEVWGHEYSVLLKESDFPVGITSRFPMTDVKRIQDGFHHGMIRCRIRGIWFFAIHFHPSNYQRRIEEASLLQAEIAKLPDSDPQVVLFGDFNGFSPADSQVYDAEPRLTKFFKMLDTRDQALNLNAGRIDYGGIEAILSQGFKDVVAESRSADAPFVGTFPTQLVADEDHGTPRRLDYIFVSANLSDRVQHAAIWRDGKTESFSDHLPVTATLAVPFESVFASSPKMLQSHGAGEGPAWNDDLGLLTSGEGNVNRRDIHGRSSVYLRDAGSNGLMFDREGRLLMCEPVRRLVSRREENGNITVLAERFQGARLNQPNDLAIDSKNRIYFTDPCYGDRNALEIRDQSGREVEGVYRIDTDGAITRIITHEVDRPNGLAITPDDRYLYVADNNNSVGGPRKLYRFQLQADGSVDSASQTLLYDWGTTRGPDGMKLDEAGRLYVAAGRNAPRLPDETADPATAGIYVFSPQGKLIEFVPISRDETTNCGFGGLDRKTLYITAGGSLWSIQTVVPGQRL